MVKLADLGGAKVIRQSITNTFSRFGTVYYMSPEMFYSDDYSFPTDIWYIGIFYCRFLLIVFKNRVFSVNWEKKVAWMCPLRVDIFAISS